MDKKKIGIAITVSLTALTTVVLSVIAAVNKGIEKFATSKGLLDSRNKKIYHWRFGDISYSVTGEGRPVLLIHNLDTCSSSVEWSEIIPVLSRTNTVYAIDLLGCGLSERPSITYTSYMYTQLVNDFIQDIVKRPASVIATGKSAAFVLEACCINQDKFGDLILINPDSIKNFRKMPTSRTKTAVLLLKSRVIGTLIYNIMMRKNNIEKKFEEKYFYDDDNISEAYVDYYFE
ncbi:MAG: alpha/beta hydrolase, partial [Clostridiales bacterium]|nr:alpha/beta hydrolase [Clostridiales bacterium]